MRRAGPRDHARAGAARRALREALETAARDLPPGAGGHVDRLVLRVPAGADAGTIGAALRRALPGGAAPATGKGERS